MSPCLPSCDPSVGTLHRNSENSYSDIEIAIPDRTLLYFLRFDEHEIQHCRLLKITVPGSVLHILKGFKRSGCAFAERLISTTVAAPNWKRPVGVLRASTSGTGSKPPQTVCPGYNSSDWMRRPTVGVRNAYLTHPSARRRANSQTLRCLWSGTTIAGARVAPIRTCREGGVRKYASVLDGPL